MRGGDGTVTIELQSTGRRVTIMADSSYVDLVGEGSARASPRCRRANRSEWRPAKPEEHSAAKPSAIRASADWREASRDFSSPGEMQENGPRPCRREGRGRKPSQGRLLPCSFRTRRSLTPGGMLVQSNVSKTIRGRARMRCAGPRVDRTLVSLSATLRSYVGKPKAAPAISSSVPTRKRTRFQVLYDESNLVGLCIRVCFIGGLQAAAAEGLGFSLLRETEGAHSHVLLKVSGYWISWFFSILRCGRSIALCLFKWRPVQRLGL